MSRSVICNEVSAPVQCNSESGRLSIMESCFRLHPEPKIEGPLFWQHFRHKPEVFLQPTSQGVAWPIHLSRYPVRDEKPNFRSPQAPQLARSLKVDKRGSIKDIRRARFRRNHLSDTIPVFLQAPFFNNIERLSYIDAQVMRQLSGRNPPCGVSLYGTGNEGFSKTATPLWPGSSEVF